MTILVTGGAGFIGSHLCDALVQRGEKVVCLDNFDPYYDPQQKLKNITSLLKNPGFTLTQGDIANPETVEKVFKAHKIRRVIHLAARAGVRSSLENPFLYTQVNVIGTICLLEAARKYRVEQFMYGSSSSVYGASADIPFHEEGNTSYPLSPYAASKKAAELYCWTYHKLYNLPITCFRFFTVYGPRGRPDMVPYIFTANILENKPITVFGDGSTQRDYTYVSDIVQGIIAEIQRKSKSFEIFNLGNSNPVCLRDFIALLEELLEKKAIIERRPLRTEDPQITSANIQKATSLLSFQPQVSLREGLKLFIEWYKTDRHLQ